MSKLGGGGVEGVTIQPPTSSIPSLLSVFCWILSIDFSVSIEIITCIFVFHSIDMVDILH